MRTLLDSTERHERRTAIVGRELERYNIDIAALSETRISGETELVEVGAGYTFFCIGQPEGQPRQAGVGFAIRTSLVPHLEGPPTGISSRLMMMKLKLKHGHSAVLLSAYAPTLVASDDDKEAFYESLSSAIQSVPFRHRLFLLGDFNARAGQDTITWPKILGHHSVGKENSNGTLLLQTCSQHQLTITNGFFQLANKYKTTWQHPRSKQWHTLDYVITRQRDFKDVHITRATRGTVCWSDHRLLRSVVVLDLCPPKRHQAVRRRKLDVAKLGSVECQEQLQETLAEKLRPLEVSHATSSAEEKWTGIKDSTYKAASEVLGFTTTKHKDWFDDQDHAARALLDTMHSNHLEWINDKSNTAKKSAYTRAKQSAQVKLREMKERWWIAKAVELQSAADRHDMKTFYAGLKAVYGPRENGCAPVKALDGSVITDRTKSLARWVEHFQSVLNHQSNFDNQVLSELPQWTTATHLDNTPTAVEIQRALNQMTSGKAPGVDGIPAEVLKQGGPDLLIHLTDLINKIWEEEAVPQDFKDALLVHVYKRKGDRACCDNHRGISLLCIAGKVLARVLLNRLNDHVHSHCIIPESQCGFRAGRGTTDMIFTARQLQEKCREQHKDLYMIFIDLTKAFDSVNREGLWQVLRKIGCPDRFVKIVESFHQGMQGRVIDGGELSDMFGVTNGTKQGCVLASLLFSIFFSMMLLIAFKDCDLGVPVQFRTDGNVFNLRRLQAHTKTFSAVIRDLLYADDCALVAHSLDDVQQLFNRFHAAAERFGLTVSMKKTEVMFQPASQSQPVHPVIKAGETTIKAVDKFCYLGSILSSDAVVDEDISARLSKATCAFGQLTKRLWNDHGIRLDTKVAIYKAAILTSLLYGCESWVLYHRHVVKLEQFHMRCLRRIAHVKWQDRIPNTEVLKICDITGIEAFLLAAQLRWTGHVIRMKETRLPKQVFYSQLQHGTRSRGGQQKRYKDVLKSYLKACNIQPHNLESLVADRSSWRSLCKASVQQFEVDRVAKLQEKRSQRKAGGTSTTGDFTCVTCGRTCASRIGLYSHRRTHP